MGSGKTTFINYLLNENHGKKIAIIENEFGEVGIDDALVKVSSAEEIVGKYETLNLSAVSITITHTLNIIDIMHGIKDYNRRRQSKPLK